MKIITEPNVHILSTSNFNPHSEYRVPPANYPGYKLVAHAGKGCYDSYGEDGRSVEEHIKSLLNSKHGSVFEHVNVSLFITGISRGLSHELVRHRHFAYSQRSTRYTNEDDASIVLDPYFSKLYNIAFNSRHDTTKITEENAREIETLKSFIFSCERSIEDYAHIVKMFPESKTRKWKRGKARQLLPHALETRITITGNIRAWRWFVEVRSGRGAESEIRRLTWHVFEALSTIYPLFFEDFIEETIDDYPEYTTMYSKI